MNVLSKCSDKYVLRGFTCYEVGHTWSASCLQAWKDVGFASYRTAFKIYFPLYLLAMFLKRKNQQKKSKLSQDLKKMFPELLRSTFFLGTNGLTFIVTFCLWRRLVTDSLTLVNTGFLPSFTCSAASVCFERKPRRSLLAVYMANIAMETIYLMLKTRKLIRPLPYGEIHSWRLRGEAASYPGAAVSLRLAAQVGAGGFARSAWQRWRPPRCPNGHHDGCLISAIYKFGRMFAFGFGLQTALRLVTALASALQSARRRRSLVGAIRGALLHPDSLRFGAFLGGLSAIYKAVGCLLIRCCHGNQRPWQWAASGLAAGGSMLAYRSSSVA
uniref:TMEM135_C_rich domain-containing protein n=1 Tax=Macrostomum lignano TaxID=282301 RepID=A0A1I8GNV1_9PLAT